MRPHQGRQGRRVLRVPRRSPYRRLLAIQDRTAFREAALALRAGPPHPERAHLTPLIRVPIGLDGPVIDLGIWLARALAHALVARDMLAHCQFVHDGLKGELLVVC